MYDLDRQNGDRDAPPTDRCLRRRPLLLPRRGRAAGCRNGCLHHLWWVPAPVPNGWGPGTGLRRDHAQAGSRRQRLRLAGDPSRSRPKKSSSVPTVRTTS